MIAPMPIFHIDTSLPPPPGAARSLADALGARMGSAPGHTWVQLSRRDPSLYAESQIETPPASAFVRVILRALPEEAELATLARSIAELVAEPLALSVEDVHVYFDPPAAGRIAFGGELVRTG